VVGLRSGGRVAGGRSLATPGTGTVPLMPAPPLVRRHPWKVDHSASAGQAPARRALAEARQHLSPPPRRRHESAAARSAQPFDHLAPLIALCGGCSTSPGAADPGFALKWHRLLLRLPVSPDRLSAQHRVFTGASAALPRNLPRSLGQAAGAVRTSSRRAVRDGQPVVESTGRSAWDAAGRPARRGGHASCDRESAATWTSPPYSPPLRGRPGWLSGSVVRGH